MLKDIIENLNESKMTDAAIGKVVDEIENVLGDKYLVSVEDYNGKDPIFYVEPTLKDKNEITVVSDIIKKRAKKYSIVVRELSDHHAFAVKGK